MFAAMALERSLCGHSYISSFDIKKLSVHQHIGNLPVCGSDNPPEGLP
jgi:hypothetical protein